MSVPDIRPVRLEIVRPGPPHNQLLSPLTPYLALCGEGSAITFHIDFEHHQLLTRLERLRYVTKSDGRYAEVPGRMREAEVTELGTEVAAILKDIQTLSTELARAQCDDRRDTTEALVHLRLMFSGSELSLIPFEMATAPLGYPGEGLEFCLQATLPIVLTRGIRRDRPLPGSWNRSSGQMPKILIAWAEPGGMNVPAKEHVTAIRRAFEPWIRRSSWKERVNDRETRARDRLIHVRKRIRLLPNASVESIKQLCATDKFTHVHILAHGDTYEYAGETRFGVALCGDGPGGRDVVNGKRLAKALQAEYASGSGRSAPLMVTLATCDSGNQMNVAVPGGSIAHELHSEGIPWVFASQFPLTVAGSVRMVEALYPRLLRGDDPRQVLFELRRELYMSTRSDHDWASIVAYASTPERFASEVAEFSSRQIKEAIKVILDYADSFALADKSQNPSSELKLEVEAVTAEVEELLRRWRCRLPKEGAAAADRALRADAIGMRGSTYKRLALMWSQIAPDKDSKEAKEAKRFYRESLKSYRDTMTEAGLANQRFYWSATQYLSLAAVDATGADDDAFELAKRLANRDIASSDDAVKAWAHATLAELAILEPYHSGKSVAPGSPEAQELLGKVKAHCAAIITVKGPHSFYVASTLRQFRRYAQQWNPPPGFDWKPTASEAVKALTPGVEVQFDYPED